MKRLWRGLSAFLQKLDAHHVVTMSASLAYYSALSMAPLLVIVLSSISVLGPTAQERFLDELSRLIGEHAAAPIRGLVQSASDEPETGGFATIVGFAVLLLSGTAVFAQLQAAMNVVWDVKATPQKAWLSWLRVRAASLAVVGGSAFLLLVSLVVTSLLAGWLSNEGPIWQAVNFAIGLVVVAGIFSLIFKMLPDVELTWRQTALGAGITALLFSVGKFAIGEYLGRASVGSAYGAAGSLVVLLTWTFYSSLIVLVGAEITAALVLDREARPATSEHAEVKEES